MCSNLAACNAMRWGGGCRAAWVQWASVPSVWEPQLQPLQNHVRALLCIHKQSDTSFGPAGPSSPPGICAINYFLILSKLSLASPPPTPCAFPSHLPLPLLYFVPSDSTASPPPALLFDRRKKQLILLIFIVVETFPALPLIKFLFIFIPQPSLSPNPRHVFIFKCAIKLLHGPRAEEELRAVGLCSIHGVPILMGGSNGGQTCCFSSALCPWVGLLGDVSSEIHWHCDVPHVVANGC